MPILPTLAFAAIVLQSAAAAPAGESRSPDEPPQSLDDIVVVASKAAEPLRQVVATVSRFDRPQFERRNVRDLADLFRHEPAIGVVGDSTRFGAQGVSIRGLEGNRVGMEVDGVPMPEAFTVGQFAAAGRDLADLDAIQRIEVMRGPSSTLYGSDALAGVVVLHTLDPLDLLRDDARLHLGARLGASGLDDSRLRSARIAMASADRRWSALVMAGRRDGHETPNRSFAQLHPANPQDTTRDSALAKLVYDAGEWRVNVACEHGRGEAQTDVRSLIRGPGRFASTTALAADDRYRRDRISAALEWNPALAWLERSELLVYGQRSTTRQDTWQTRVRDATTPFPSLRYRRFDFEQVVRGLEWVGQARSEGAVSHWHVFGFEYAHTTFRDQRDGFERNLTTGATSNVVLGERFPVRDFPDSTTREFGVFWQDQIGFGERFALVPGLRWERYRLGAHPDAMFLEDYPRQRVVDVARSAWSPKLGLRFSPTPDTTLYAQIARGFRSPPFSDVNIGLSLAALNYEVRPNPDLRPERSTGVELGWRWQAGTVLANVAVFRNEYRDLIDSRANLGTDPASGALVFQSVNRARARIEGVEGELRWSPTAESPWHLDAAAAWTRGEDTARRRPLNSVAPAKVVLGAEFAPRDADWGFEARFTAVRRQPRLDNANGVLFRAPGHALVDVHAWWQPASWLTLRMAAQNLGNRMYWDSYGTRGVLAGAKDVDFYTRSGRHISVTAALDW